MLANNERGKTNMRLRKPVLAACAISTICTILMAGCQVNTKPSETSKTSNTQNTTASTTKQATSPTTTTVTTISALTK